jgi:hypothetical protein
MAGAIECLQLGCCEENCVERYSVGSIRDLRKSNLVKYKKNDRALSAAIARDKSRNLEDDPPIRKEAQGRYIWQQIEAAKTYGYRFVVQAARVCQRAWAILNGFSESRVSRFKARIDRGDMNPYPKKCASENKENEHENHLDKLLKGDKLQGTKLTWIGSWLRDQEKSASDYMPTSDGVTRLPFFNATAAWCTYRALLRELKQFHLLPSYSWFCECKQADPSLERLRYMRKTGTLGKCDKCGLYELELAKVQPSDDEAREALYMKYRGHLILQQMERLGYYQRRFLAVRYPRLFLSGILDGANQANFELPAIDRHLKSQSRKLRLKQGLVGVHFHGLGTYFYPLDSTIACGSRQTCHALSDALAHVATSAYRDSELPKTLFLQLDNCGSDNKNRFFFGFLSSLVANGTFDTIVCSFLIVGHTHEDIDQIFSVITSYMKGKVYLTFADFDETLRNAYHSSSPTETDNNRAGNNVYVRRTKTIGDYAGWVEPHLDDKFEGHSRPLCFVFQAQQMGTTRSCVLKYRSFSVSDVWYPLIPSVDGKTSTEEIYKDEEALMAEAEAMAESHETRLLGGPSRKRRLVRQASVKSQAASHEEQLVKTVKAGLPDLDELLYSGRGYLFHESQKSIASFTASPGIQLLVSRPAFRDLNVHPAASIENVENVREAIRAFTYRTNMS